MMQPEDPWANWFHAAALPTVDARLRELCARIQADIADRGPVCWASGKCCKFDTFGHRLYVTALEIAWVLLHAPSPIPTDADLPISAGVAPANANQPIHLNLVSHADACIFQHDRQCTIHTIRPLACRLFFCERGTEQWQHNLHESIIHEVKNLHRELAITYRYMEWRTGLAEAQTHLTTSQP